MKTYAPRLLACLLGCFVFASPVMAATIDTPVLYNETTGLWSFRESLTTGGVDFTAAHGGQNNGGIFDYPVIGDWDGDQIDEVGIARADDGNWQWFLSGTNTGFADDATSGFNRTSFAHGDNTTDVPLVGDWNGDGVDSVGLARDNNGSTSGGNLRWILTNTVGAGTEIQFDHGEDTDIPIVGDWDGDGVDTPGLIRNQSGEMRWILTNDLIVTGSTTFVLDRRTGDFGVDLPVVGDWTGDGQDSIGFYRPSTHQWFLFPELTSPASALLEFGSTVSGPTHAFGAVTQVTPEPASAATLVVLGLAVLYRRR